MVQVFVEVLAPVFAVVAVGFALAPSVGVEPPALTVITYWILGPAFVFELLAGAELAPEVVGKVVASTVLGMMIIAAVAVLVMRALGRDFSTTSATVLTSIQQRGEPLRPLEKCRGSRSSHWIGGGTFGRAPTSENCQVGSLSNRALKKCR